MISHHNFCWVILDRFWQNICPILLTNAELLCPLGKKDSLMFPNGGVQGDSFCHVALSFLSSYRAAILSNIPPLANYIASWWQSETMVLNTLNILFITITTQIIVYQLVKHLHFVCPAIGLNICSGNICKWVFFRIGIFTAYSKRQTMYWRPLARKSVQPAWKIDQN